MLAMVATEGVLTLYVVQIVQNRQQIGQCLARTRPTPQQHVLTLHYPAINRLPLHIGQKLIITLLQPLQQMRMERIQPTERVIC